MQKIDFRELAYQYYSHITLDAIVKAGLTTISINSL